MSISPDHSKDNSLKVEQGNINVHFVHGGEAYFTRGEPKQGKPLPLESRRISQTYFELLKLSENEEILLKRIVSIEVAIEEKFGACVAKIKFDDGIEILTTAMTDSNGKILSYPNLERDRQTKLDYLERNKQLWQ